MESNYCPNCGKEIKENAKFCTNCGAKIKIASNKNIEKKEISNEFGVQRPATSKLTKIILGLIIGIALLFIAKVLLLDSGIIKNNLSSTSALNKLEGKWYDPTGVILDDKEAIITLRKKGDIVVGNDKDNKIYIQLFSVGGLNYQGLVVLNDVDGDFLIHYYPDEEKLVFFSTLTKSGWNIKRVK